ncbi:MAG TPA: hypothetical protein VMZ90_10050 [Vicinamibacterales bacterium]|nr:hypothetical protein [Vicinamibacterales bacterium]
MNMHNAGPTPIVILATEMIRDISELCAQMALLNRRTATPAGPAPPVGPVLVPNEDAR